MEISFEKAVETATTQGVVGYGAGNEISTPKQCAEMINKAGTQTKHEWYYDTRRYNSHDGGNTPEWLLSGSDYFVFGHKVSPVSVLRVDCSVNIKQDTLDKLTEILNYLVKIEKAKPGSTCLAVESTLLYYKVSDHMTRENTHNIIENAEIFDAVSENKLAEGKTFVEAMQYFAENPIELLKKYSDIEYSLVSIEDGEMKTPLDMSFDYGLDAVSENSSEADIRNLKKIDDLRNLLIGTVKKRYNELYQDQSKQIPAKQISEQPAPTKKKSLMDRFLGKFGYGKTPE